MKKLVTATSIGIEVPYEGEEKDLDLALIDVTEKGERFGKAVLLSSAELNEGIAQASEEALEKIDVDVDGEEITITPTTSEQIKTPSKGKNAITKVTVNAVTAGIDANIAQENIKDGVTILGVNGNLDETILTLQTKTGPTDPFPNDPASALAALDGNYVMGVLKTLYNYNASAGNKVLLVAKKQSTSMKVWRCYLSDINVTAAEGIYGSANIEVTIESEAPTGGSTSGSEYDSESGGGVVITTVNYLLEITEGTLPDLEVRVTPAN